MKTLAKYGVELAAETGVYASGTPAPAATDGFLVYDVPEVEVDWQYDGKREGRAAAGLAALMGPGAAGTWAKVPLKHYAKGAGAAYSASVKPTPHLLLASLLGQSAVTTTVGSEKWTYSCLSDNFTSLVSTIFNRGQQYGITGGLVPTLDVNFKGMSVPTWEASLQGVLPNLPTDAAVPAITYPAAAVRAPKATSVNLVLTTGGQTYTARVTEFGLKLAREIVERENLNTAGHGGFWMGALTATMDLTIEAETLATATPWLSATQFNPYQLYQNGSVLATSLQVGSTQYNRYTFSTSNAQIVAKPSEDKNGPVATWKLSLQVLSADDAADLDFTVKFD